MSRSGYSDDVDGIELLVWQGAVASAMRGKRGQRLLRDMVAALEAMPSKRLIAGLLVDGNGECCALGAVGRYRGIPDERLIGKDQTGIEATAHELNISETMARAIAYENDEWALWYAGMTPEQRHAHMIRFAKGHLIEEPAT